MDPPAQFLARTCLGDTELEGVSIRAGDQVMLSMASANRDPIVFDNPDHFDIDRGGAGHLSFGDGPHICPGALLARLEARLALRCFTRRVGSLELAEGYSFDHAPTGMLHGPRTLSLVLQAAS